MGDGLKRRTLLAGAGLPLGWGWASVAQAAPAGREHAAQQQMAPQLKALEAAYGTRIGFMAIDTAQPGRQLAWRADERFSMASTFKLLLAIAMARGVDQGRWQWSDTLPLQESDRRPHAPAFERLLSRGHATISEMVDGILILSDNPTANALLRRMGGDEGPAALTRFLREHGDAVTRLDRWELELNENRPGDPRDTSSPRAFAELMRRMLLDGGLSRDARARVLASMAASETGLARLRAGVPAGWQVVDKTGTGARGAVNDVAVAWPEGRAPWVVVVFQTGSTRSSDALCEVHVQVMQALVKAWG
jgi:beta-lactamase class A